MIILLYYIAIMDGVDVCESLNYLSEEDMIELGVALGLSYSNLTRMTSTMEIVTAWLNREDMVLIESGNPTWTTLADALDKIGQAGIAKDVRQRTAFSGLLSTGKLICCILLLHYYYRSDVAMTESMHIHKLVLSYDHPSILVMLFTSSC